MFFIDSTWWNNLAWGGLLFASVVVVLIWCIFDAQREAEQGIAGES